MSIISLSLQYLTVIYILTVEHLNLTVKEVKQFPSLKKKQGRDTSNAKKQGFEEGLAFKEEEKCFTFSYQSGNKLLALVIAYSIETINSIA
jgi:hypothetical protein